MRNRIIRLAAGVSLAALVAVPAAGFGTQAFADPTPNDNNCVGVRITSLTPPGAGPIVKGIASGGPGAVADLVHDTQELCDD
jgi:hypothetical protein